jgi:FMN reductase
MGGLSREAAATPAEPEEFVVVPFAEQLAALRG